MYLLKWWPIILDVAAPSLWNSDAEAAKEILSKNRNLFGSQQYW